MSAAKGALLGVWLVCAAGFAIPSDATELTSSLGAMDSTESMGVAFARWARFAFWLMLAAHLVEFSLFSSRLKKAPGPLAAHFLHTMVFGVLHIRSVPPGEEEAGEASASSP